MFLKIVLYFVSIAPCIPDVERCSYNVSILKYYYKSSNFIFGFKKFTLETKIKYFF
jgi:hypothetical protein